MTCDVTLARGSVKQPPFLMAGIQLHDAASPMRALCRYDLSSSSDKMHHRNAPIVNPGSKPVRTQFEGPNRSL